MEWRLAFDTAVDALFDKPPLIVDSYVVQGHSAVLLTDGLHERRLRARHS